MKQDLEMVAEYLKHLGETLKEQNLILTGIQKEIKNTKECE